jgi:hypothetical protein
VSSQVSVTMAMQSNNKCELSCEVSDSVVSGSVAQIEEVEVDQRRCVAAWYSAPGAVSFRRRVGGGAVSKDAESSSFPALGTDRHGR